ncbi:beta barrel domain-containing protein [Streptomyces virginiae]
MGRKFLYLAEHGRERRERYDFETGLEDVKVRQARLYTQEQYDEQKQRQSLLSVLLEAGIDVRSNARSSLSTDQLRTILATVKQGA